MKIAIIIQGPCTNIFEQIKTWYPLVNQTICKDITIVPIFSTWKGSEHFFHVNDICICSDPPEPSYQNFKHQLVSTYKGLEKAKELDCTHALKIRSDLIPTNPKDFIKMIANENINMLAYANHSYHYYIDYVMSGPIDFMIQLWGMQEYEYKDIENQPAEVKLSRQIYKILHKDRLFDLQIHLFLDKLDNENDLYWIKNNVHLSEYQAKRKSRDHWGYTAGDHDFIPYYSRF